MKTEEDMILNDEVELPYMRRELVLSLKALSDLDYQYAIWVRGEFPHENFYDSLYNTLNIIYDDSDLAVNSEDYIGSILKNEEEMHALDKVVEALQVIFDTYGEALSDKEYIELTEWRNVIPAAKEAYELIREKRPVKHL